jgi:hypothetical protein
VVLSSAFALPAPEANLVSLGRYALRGVGRAQELFTLCSRSTLPCCDDPNRERRR